MIFKIFQMQRMIREGKENPSNFASNQAGDLFKGIFVMPVISALIFFGIFFVLGYTTLLGGPYGFFKFLFVLTLIGIVFFVLILRKLYRAIKQTTKTVVDKTIIVESKIVE